MPSIDKVIYARRIKNLIFWWQENFKCSFDFFLARIIFGA